MNRRLIISAVIGAVIVAAALVGISLAGGDDATVDSADTDRVTTLLQGIPQSGDTLGEPDAAVTITEYADVQCPFCAQASEELLPGVIRTHVRPGDAKIVFKPLGLIEPVADSERGALAAQAAGMQDKMWNFVEVLYAGQGREGSGWVTEDKLRSVAEAAGLEVDRFEDDFAGDDVATEYFADQEAARTDGEGGGAVSGTPFFVIEGPEGRTVINGLTDNAMFDAAVARVS